MIYDSIETLPLRVYSKIANTGNLQLLGEGDPGEILIAWEKINKEFYEEFGINDSKVFEMQNKIRYLNLMLDYYAKGDKFAKTLANIELQKNNVKEGKGSYLKVCVSVSKALEMKIDYATVTVGEFFHYLNMAEEISKQYKSK